MIKLLTLENLSAFSSDTVYKICLSLEKYLTADENIISFESYESLFNAADFSLRSGDEIIIAVEGSDYNAVKHEFASRFSLEEYSCPQIAEAIAMCPENENIDFDMPEHCTIVKDSIYHLSADGLYSGFSVKINEGLCTFIPLDFSRIDDILESYINKCLAPSQNNESYDNGSYSSDSEEYDFKEPVSKMIYSLIQIDKKVAIATSEATMYIYNLYDKIDGLSDVVNFVEIVDQTPESVEQTENENFDEEQNQTQSFDENSEENADTQEEANINLPAVTESACAKTIRHAREAKINTAADYGAAVSDVYSNENPDGSVSYFAFVAVADDQTTKTKKINTNNEEEAKLLLPHCVTVLSETVCQKIDAVNVNESDEKSDKKPQEKKLSKGMIIFAAVVLLIAIATPIYIVSSLFSDNKAETTTGVVNVVQTGDFLTTTLPPVSETTTQGFPGINETTTEGIFNSVTANPSLTAAEPTASEYSVSTTAPSLSSSSGTFTFYVFGYGHGVGLSQYGANYLASQGWNYAQILANYYYGSTLVSGDEYPETIKYNGTEYKTRDYLAGVLEGEMGSSFLPEALKAQVVAIYTFAKYYGFEVGTDSNAYKANPSQSCYDAVDEVMKNGLYISYGGQTALTPFHAISAGLTTSYYNAWGGTALPYLGGGRPSYGDYNAPNFKTTYTISSADLKTLVESKNLGISLGGDPATWLSVLSHDRAISDDVGYVSSISVGGKIISGNEFRSKIMEGRIRSHCFMIVYTPDNA